MQDLSRPDAAEVGRRIIVLSCVTSRVRAALAGQAPPEAAHSIVTWLRTHGLHESASLRELRFLSVPPGATPRNELVQLSWRTEACGTLLWATYHLAHLPACDVLMDSLLLLDALADAHHAPAEFIAHIRLRSAMELEAQRHAVLCDYQNAPHNSQRRSITRERLFALNWLCGKCPGADWEATPVDPPS